MYDVVPEQVWIWQRLERIASEILNSYGYQEIRFPVVELTELFTAAVGESTDVVSKEMFTFANRKGVSISLRPEGTASVVRAVLQNGLINQQTQKLWYRCPMFRYERPQKGRNRQFDQIGAEVFGLATPDVDAELLLLTARLWRRLGLTDVALQINTLGSTACRAHYRDVLIEYFSDHTAALDDDARNRLHSNPLRILDSKNPEMRDLIAAAPVITEHLNAESRDHFSQLLDILDACELAYQVNPRLVRGLDYYTHNVFEWVTDSLGAQGTICAGGRYDNLVEMQGGKPTPATGFAMGVDRLIELIRDQNLWQPEAQADVYVVIDPGVPSGSAMQQIESIRDALPDLKVLVNAGGGSFKSQFKKADKCGASFAIIVGEEELQQSMLSIKPLKDRGSDQQQLTTTELLDFLRQQFKQGTACSKN